MNIVTPCEQYGKLTQKLFECKNVYFILMQNNIPTVFEGMINNIIFRLKESDIEVGINFGDGDCNLYVTKSVREFGNTVFFTRQEAEEAVSCLQTQSNQILSKLKTGHFKITKNKPYRVNFAYQGNHYSIQERGDLYEEYVALTCKENPSFFIELPMSATSLCRLIPPMKQGQTYRDTDLSKIKEIVSKYVISKEQESDFEKEDDCSEER